jgi:hypothetical protein
VAFSHVARGGRITTIIVITIGGALFSYVSIAIIAFIVITLVSDG